MFCAKYFLTETRIWSGQFQHSTQTSTNNPLFSTGILEKVSLLFFPSDFWFFS